MRQSIAAAALICTERDGRMLWLAQWNARWQRYHLVGGHKQAGESFRQCIVREINEELALQEGADLSVSQDPSAHLEYVAWSEGFREETAYTIELFEAELSVDAKVRIMSDARNRWLAEREVRAGLASDGRPVSNTMKRLLREVSWKNKEL